MAQKQLVSIFCVLFIIVGYLNLSHLGVLNLQRNASSIAIENMDSDTIHAISDTQSILDELHLCKKCQTNTKHIHMMKQSFQYPNESFLRQHSANSVCKYLFPAYSFHSVTHKNGVFLFNEFVRYLWLYCRVPPAITKAFKYNSGFMQTLGMKWNNIFQLFYFIQESINLYKEQKINYKIVFLFQIREPLDVLWSAYQYHKTCPTGNDPWLASFHRSYSCIYNKHDKLLIQWNDKRFNNHPLLAYNKSINIEYAIDHQYSLCDYLNDSSISIEDMDNLAIYYQFIRYINCQTPVTGWFWLHTLYSYFKSVTNSSNVFNMSYFSMHDWLTDYDQTVYRFIDAFNVIDNEENRHILKAHDVNHINITEEREELFKMLSSQNTNKWSTARRKRTKHINMFDSGYKSSKRNAIEWLLKHDQICHIIRNMTMSFDFVWKYNDFC